MSGIMQQPTLGSTQQQQCASCSRNPCNCSTRDSDGTRGYGGLGIDQQSPVQQRTQMESDQQALREMNDRRLIQQQHLMEDNKHPSATGITTWDKQEKQLDNSSAAGGLTPVINTETSRSFDPNTRATTVHEDRERSLGDKITGKLSGMMQSITGGSGTTHSQSQQPGDSGFTSATASGANPQTRTYVGQDDQGNTVHFASSSSHS